MGSVASSVEKKLNSVPANMMENQKQMMLKQRELQMAMSLAGAKVGQDHSQRDYVCPQSTRQPVLTCLMKNIN
jgi:hypothetical protein